MTTFKFGDFWDRTASYPTTLNYRLITEDERGTITFTEELDAFAEKYKDYEIIDFTFFVSSGGIGLTVYLRGGDENG